MTVHTRYEFQDGQLVGMTVRLRPLPAEPPRPAPEPFAAQPAQDVVDAPPADSHPGGASPGAEPPPSESVAAGASAETDATAATRGADALPDAAAGEMPPEGAAAETAAEDAAAPSRLRQAFGDYSITERLGMGTVRGGKMGLFGAIGEAAAYGVDNVASIGLPPGTGFAIGCVLYGVNKALVPKNGGIL